MSSPIRRVDEEPGNSLLNSRIAQRVRALRGARKLTGADVERLSLGAITLSVLSRLENGKGSWQAHHIEAVATALGVPPRDLLPAPDDAPRDNPAPPPLTPAESALLSAVRARDWPAALRALAHLADK